MFLLLLGNGFEEIEAVGTLDLMRRAKIDVKSCTVNATPLVLGAHGIALEADLCLSELPEDAAFDGLVLPGGMGGVEALAATPQVIEMVQKAMAEGKLIAAICAAPSVVLAKAGVTAGRRVTGFPAPDLIENLGESYVDETIVIDGNLVTAKGPGSLFAFAREIIAYVKDAAAARSVLDAAIAEC